MDNPETKKWKVEVMEISLKKQIQNGKYAYNNTSNRVASLTPDPVNHIGDPGTTENSGQGEDAHNNTDIRLRTTMLYNIQRKKEKSPETRHGKKISEGHGNECRAIEHVILSLTIFSAILEAGRYYSYPTFSILPRIFLRIKEADCF
jgi:hypothetical protein